MSLSVIPWVASAIGMIANQDAQRRQQNAVAKAQGYQERALALEEDRYNNFSRPAMERIFELANGYDPAREARAGIDHASDVTAETISKALKGLNADFRAGGGIPQNSTEFQVKAQGMTNRASDPLRSYLAEAMSNPTQKRINLLMGALGQAPAGGLSQAYFNASQNQGGLAGMQPQADWSGTSRLLGDLIDNLRRTQSGGAGGRGDTRGQGTSGGMQSILDAVNQGLVSGGY